MSVSRVWIAFLLVAFAFTARATPQTFSFTIDVPSPGKAVVWVDPTGTVVAPGSVTNSLYFDANGFMWRLSNPGSATPVANTGPGPGGASLLYESSNCTGRALIMGGGSSSMTEVIQIYDGGLFFVGTQTITSTSNSYWLDGRCWASTATGIFFVAQQVYPPTLPAGPYHLEYR